MSDEDEHWSAMLLTEAEWRMLADICECYVDQAGARTVAAKHAELADRIIKAGRE